MLEKSNLTNYILKNSLKIFGRPQEIIVFVIGGITFEETLAIHNINKAYAGNIKVVIGGTYLHSFKTFIDEVNCLVSDYKDRSRPNVRNL